MIDSTNSLSIVVRCVVWNWIAILSSLRTEKDIYFFIFWECNRIRWGKSPDATTAFCIHLKSCIFNQNLTLLRPTSKELHGGLITAEPCHTHVLLLYSQLLKSTFGIVAVSFLSLHQKLATNDKLSLSTTTIISVYSLLRSFTVNWRIINEELIKRMPRVSLRRFL